MPDFHFYFKAFHLIGMVAWFAGLFYLVRIFVYHAEAQDKPAVERAILIAQFKIMEQRVLKIIVTPGMVWTWIFGIAMLVNNPAFLQQGWIHVKLLLLIVLSGYHGYCSRLVKQMAKDEVNFTSFQFRLLNEVPTLFLFSIIFLAVLKSTLNTFYLFVGIILLGAVFYFAAKAYRKRRTMDDGRRTD